MAIALALFKSSLGRLYLHPW